MDTLAMKKDHRVRFVAVVVFIVDVLALTVVLALLWTMRSKNQQCTQLCLPNVHGKAICGCHADRLLSYLDQQYLQSQKRVATEKEQAPHALRLVHMQKMSKEWNLKPVAHLQGSKLSDKIMEEYKDSSMAPIREWEQGNNCFLQNGMSYRNGRLVVPVSGLYHVYSFVDMYQDYSSGQMNETIPMSISMGVFRTNILNKKIPEEMICTYRPYEKSRNNRFTVYDSYIGADVRLDAWDEVYIKVSNLTYVKNPSRNVFGMHLL